MLMAFKLYNLLSFKGQPDMTLEGLTPCSWYSRGPFDSVAVGKWASEQASDLLIVDFEALCGDVRIQSAECVAQGHAQRIAAFRAARKEKKNPRAKVGTYAMCPNADYWTPVSPTEDKMLAWQGSNRFNSLIADEMDVVNPSLYAFYDDEKGWLKFALANIEEAYKYGKPVIPFICPHYHHSDPKFRNTMIPYFGTILDTVRERCDSAILWGGWWFGSKDVGKGDEPGHPWPWEPNFAWFKEVQRIVRGL
ncbi:MAG: hypothetical protein U0573_04430 [Phycisphaerales bacterium]|nr:hypothetical protein [Planctomycetota bacterium]